MNLKNKIYTIFNTYKIIFLGAFLLSIYIYMRFIRERLPRNIPYTLTTLSFIILIELCIIYAYIIFRLLKPAKNNNEIIQIILNNIYKPFEELNTYFNNLPYIKIYYPKFLFWFIYKFEFIFTSNIFYIIFYIFPRVVLITALTIDIFYFHKLFYIYKVLLIGILLFLRRYILYNLRQTTEQLVKEITPLIDSVTTKYVYGVHPSEWPENIQEDDEDEDEWIPTMNLSLEIFIDHYISQKINENEVNNYTVYFSKQFYTIYGHTVRLHFSKDKSVSERIENPLCENKRIEYKQMLKNILQLKFILEYYNMTIAEHKYLKIIKLEIYFMYFICWTYILIASLHTLNIMEIIEILTKSWVTINEPFSEIGIYD